MESKKLERIEQMTNTIESTSNPHAKSVEWVKAQISTPQNFLLLRQLFAYAHAKLIQVFSKANLIFEDTATKKCPEALVL